MFLVQLPRINTVSGGGKDLDGIYRPDCTLRIPHDDQEQVNASRCVVVQAPVSMRSPACSSRSSDHLLRLPNWLCAQSPHWLIRSTSYHLSWQCCVQGGCPHIGPIFRPHYLWRTPPEEWRAQGVISTLSGQTVTYMVRGDVMVIGLLSHM